MTAARHVSGNARRQNVEDAIDRAWGRLLHPFAVVGLIAGELYGAHAVAETARQICEHLFVAAGRHHAGRAHRERDRNG